MRMCVCVGCVRMRTAVLARRVGLRLRANGPLRGSVCRNSAGSCRGAPTARAAMGEKRGAEPTGGEGEPPGSKPRSDERPRGVSLAGAGGSDQAEQLIRSARELSRRLSALKFSPPVAHVYDAFGYAIESYSDYARKYAGPECEVLLLGMNPGPFGMAQTGIPFGDVTTVRDWLRITDWAERRGSDVCLPEQHPKRPLVGQRHPQVERSGERLWSLAKNRWDGPGAFFSRFFVYNYCPLAFVKDSKTGTNLTPDKLKREERAAVEEACDQALREVLQALQPRYVVGVGNFARDCAERCASGRKGVVIGKILHPSPASPAGNGLGKWEQTAAQQLTDLGIELPTRRIDAMSVK